MMTRRAGVTLFVAMALAAAPAHVDARPGSDLPPVAAGHNARGVALIAAGEYDAAVRELALAYAAMPDPLLWRAGRGKVMGSLRSALGQQHATTGDARPLCRLQALLREHIEALLLALGDAARADDVAGSVERLREVDAALAGARCTPAPQPVPAPEILAPAPSRIIVPPAAPARLIVHDRRLATAGAASIAVGLLGFTTMAVGVVLHHESRDRLREWTNDILRGEDPGDPGRADRALRRGQQMRALAISGGIIGALALATGVTLRVLGRRAPRHARLSPTGGPGHLGALARIDF